MWNPGYSLGLGLSLPPTAIPYDLPPAAPPTPFASLRSLISPEFAAETARMTTPPSVAEELARRAAVDSGETNGFPWGLLMYGAIGVGVLYVGYKLLKPKKKRTNRRRRRAFKRYYR